MSFSNIRTKKPTEYQNSKAEIETKRIANILVYFANNTENFGVTKANKLLYYLDCLHLLKYGRTVTKDKYIKNRLGPVPTKTTERLALIQEFNSLPEEDRQKFSHDLMSEYLTITPKEISRGYILEQIVPLKEFEPIWFSKSEIEIMKELAEKYRDTTATELVQKTHKESPYKETEMFDIIDLKLFLKDHNVPQDKIDHIAYIEKLIDEISRHYQ